MVVQRALTIQHQVGPESDLAGWTMVDNAPGRSAAETDYNLVSAGISRIGRAILAPYEDARCCKPWYLPHSKHVYPEISFPMIDLKGGKNAKKKTFYIVLEHL